MKVKFATQSTTINAPRSQVFQRFASFKKDKPPSETGEGATILEREGGRLLVEFVSRDGRRLYRTLEEVMLYPEERRVSTKRSFRRHAHHIQGTDRMPYSLSARRGLASGVPLRSPRIRERRQTAHGDAEKAAEAPGAGDMMNEGE